MLFEKIRELLAALAVAVAGATGVDAAANHADPPANDAAVSLVASQADEDAAIRAATAQRRSSAVHADFSAVGPTDGLARAVEALTQAMENAPAAADHGLEQAMHAVTGSPANEAPGGPPADRPGSPRIPLPDAP